MDIRGLRYFIRTAECLNFTKAAKECFITQTAMSQHIANMEKELGFKLFTRNNRSVSLTPSGREFYEQMKILIQDYDTVVKRSQNISSGSEGTIKIAFINYIEGMVLMPRLRALKEQHPSIKITTMILSPSKMLEQLRRGHCDIAVCWPHDLQEAKDLTYQNLAEFNGQLICSADHPLAAHQSVSQEDLPLEKIVTLDLKNMPGTYRAMCGIWKQLGLTPPFITDFEQYNYVEELLLTVNLNNCVAFVPEYMEAYMNHAATFLKLDMQSAPKFQLAAGYCEDYTNPVLETVLHGLQDKRIPLNY